MKLFTKNRFLVFPAMLLVFALACALRLAPEITLAAGSFDPAVVGTASLTDEGDTVFIRCASREDDETITWMGYTVGNMGPEEDPLANVDMNTLTPIDQAAPLSGTVDKDIYICGGGTVEIFVDGLTLTEGHKIIIASGNGLDVKMGKLTVSEITGGRPLYVGDKASVTVNGNVFVRRAELYKPAETEGAYSSYNPDGLSGVLTVNGNLIGSDSYTGIVEVNHDSGKLTVSGDITGFSQVAANFGGSVSVEGSVSGCRVFASSNSSIEVKGDIAGPTLVIVGDWSMEHGSTLTVGGSVSCQGLFYMTRSFLDIAGMLTCGELCLQDMLAPVSLGSALPDESTALEAGPSAFINTDASVSGNIQTGWLSLLGKTRLTADDMKGTHVLLSSFNSGSEVQNSADLNSLTASGWIDVQKFCRLTVRNDVSTDAFIVARGPVDMGGNMSAGAYINVLYGGDLKAGGDVSANGDILVASSSLKAGGSITSKGSLINFLFGSAAEAGGDVSAPGPIMAASSSLKAGGSISSSSSYVASYFGSTVEAKGSIAGLDDIYCLSSSTMKADGDVRVADGSIHTQYGAQLESGGDISANYVHAGGVENGQTAAIKVNGNLTSDGFNIYSGSVSIGGDLKVSMPFEGYSFASLTVGGDLINAYSQNDSPSCGITFTNGTSLTVGGNVEFGKKLLDFQSGMENLNVGGHINAYRVSNILLDVISEDEDGHKNYRGLRTVPPFSAASGTSYSIPYAQPYRQSYVLLEDTDGVLYYADITDLNKRAYNVHPANMHTVTYVPGDRLSWSENAVLAGSSITGMEIRLPGSADFKEDGLFLFAGWNTAEDGSGAAYDGYASVSFDEDVTLYAQTRTRFTDVRDDIWYTDAVDWALKNGVTHGMGENTFQPNVRLTRAMAITFLYNLDGSPDVSALSEDFSDVEDSDWYLSAVKWAIGNGITSGYGSGTFQPDAECTRAMTVAFLMNYAKYKGVYTEPAGAAVFTDVNPDAWYAKAVDWAAANKITSGMGVGTFQPNAICTRAMMVTYLHNYTEKFTA